MQIEKWDILNENGVPTGRTTLRGNYIFKKGEYHLVVHIWILSPDGKILIQRRSDTKRLMPGEWAATGGAAQAGETSFTAAARELYEELGIKSDEKSLKFVSRMKRKSSFLDIWKIETSISAEGLRLQKSEVSAAKWVSTEEFKKMIENNEYHNYGKEYFDMMLNETEKTRGQIDEQ